MPIDVVSSVEEHFAHRFMAMEVVVFSKRIDFCSVLTLVDQETLISYPATCRSYQSTVMSLLSCEHPAAECHLKCMEKK